MRKERIRWLVLLGTISMIGIALAQIFWVNRALTMAEKELDQTLHVSLMKVAQHMAEFNESQLPSNRPVSQLASNYFVVAIDDKIDANILEHYLSAEFNKQNLDLDFEYGIYDCYTDKMVYGNYVGKGKNTSAQTELPTWEDNIYYFGVRFPQLKQHIYGQLEFWVLTTAILIAVLVFFGYALFVILKQKRLSEVQKDFVNTMTHEFKTPLSTIAISANVLADSSKLTEDERLHKYINIIVQENNQLKKQVDKLLQMTDLEKDKIELKLEQIDLHEFISSIVGHLELRVNEAKGELKLDVKASPCLILADKVHLTNILYNLLDNALKYTEGPPEIVVSTSSENGAIELTVADNGLGIEEVQQKKIFDKFYRVPKGNVHDVKGFGLGLSYIAKLTKAHKWKLNLKSALGQGSAFTIIIDE